MGTGKGRRWQRVRELILARQPVCPDPFGLHAGRVVPAVEVDHIVPHRGRRELFWDATNLWALCRECHAEKTRREKSAREKTRSAENVIAEKQVAENHLSGKCFAENRAGAKIENEVPTITKSADDLIARVPHRVRLDARALVRAMTGVEPPQPAAATMPWRTLYETADLMIEAALPHLARQRWLEAAVVPYSAATLRRAQNWGNARIIVETMSDAEHD
jgi:hypothetical protein